MAFTGAVTSGNNDDQNGIGGGGSAIGKSQPMNSAKKLFVRKNPGAPGKLSKNASTRSESLAKLRGKGALA
jgi:hypothetical protein